MTDARIVFTPSGREGRVPVGTTVLDAARRLGVDLDSVCGGRAVCGRCQFVASTGTFPKWSITADERALGPLTSVESPDNGRRLARPLLPGRRLGCAATVQSDAVVDVPADCQVHRPVVRKDLALDGVVVDPLVHLAYLEIPPPALAGAASAADLLVDALAQQHGLSGVPIGLAALASLQPSLARGDGAVTVAVRTGSDGRRVVAAVWPGFVDRVVGIAVDVGSTTLAAHLCDLASGEVLASHGRMNPQIRFGEDLMSRVSYVMMNPGGAGQLTAAVREAIDELAGELSTACGVGRDAVLDVVVVGNPVMHHLVLGLDPTPLGQAPFTLATARSIDCAASDIGLSLPFAAAYVGPCIAGHVGADAAAAILSEGPHRSLHMQLLVDVGTNAEIVLGSRDRVWAASSPTGPAFEGAQISCGQRAAVGAIERVRIDRTTFEPRVKVIGCDLWSDHPSFDAVTAALEINGVCGSGIVEVIGELFLAGVVTADGVIDGSYADRTPRVVPDGRTFSYVLWKRGRVELRITQGDVRAIQLAKAALRAGIDLLLDAAGHPEVSDLRLAGAFGAHLDPRYAMVLGLVPDAPLDAVRSVGNAAGHGAVRALLSAAERTEMERAVLDVVKVETATEPRFQELFVAAMAFPHATAPSPHLGAVVELPVRIPRPPHPSRPVRTGRRA